MLTGIQRPLDERRMNLKHRSFRCLASKLGTARGEDPLGVNRVAYSCSSSSSHTPPPPLPPLGSGGAPTTTTATLDRRLAAPTDRRLLPPSSPLHVRRRSKEKTLLPIRTLPVGNKLGRGGGGAGGGGGGFNAMLVLAPGRHPTFGRGGREVTRGIILGATYLGFGTRQLIP